MTGIGARFVSEVPSCFSVIEFASRVQHDLVMVIEEPVPRAFAAPFSEHRRDSLVLPKVLEWRSCLDRTCFAATASGASLSGRTCLSSCGSRTLCLIMRCFSLSSY